MVKTKLKLIEISDLSEEIHGLQDRQTGEKVQKGLLDEKLSLVQKYWLTDLGKKTKEVVDEVEPLRNEVISKYGTTGPDGGIGISAIIEEKNEEGVVISNSKNSSPTNGNRFIKSRESFTTNVPVMNGDNKSSKI